MQPERARMLSPLQLAYIGDTVWDMLIRSRLIFRGLNVHHMHQEASTRVCAAAQAKAMTRITALLDETERGIVQRGRNAHARHPDPKNQSAADYQAATGLEALVGYLYLTGQEERLLQLFTITQEEE